MSEEFEAECGHPFCGHICGEDSMTQTDKAAEPVAWLTRHSLGPLQFCDADYRPASDEWSAPFPVYAHPQDAESLRAENERLRDVIAYCLQDDLHNRLTPRVVDIAYSAFMSGACGKNKDDGGKCDWFTDTKPMVMGMIAEIVRTVLQRKAGE